MVFCSDPWGIQGLPTPFLCRRSSLLPSGFAERRRLVRAVAREGTTLAADAGLEWFGIYRSAYVCLEPV